MIYELKEPKKAEKLFAGMDDTLIRACLQGVMGKVYVTDLEKPRSALAQLGRHLFYAGEPEREYTCLWLDDILDRTIDNPDRSQWDGYCGRYERRNEKPRIYEILRRGEDLYVQFVNSAGEAPDLKLYPIGENRFGIAWSDDEIVFAGGDMLLGDIVCQRL